MLARPSIIKKFKNVYHNSFFISPKMILIPSLKFARNHLIVCVAYDFMFLLLDPSKFSYLYTKKYNDIYQTR